MINSDQSRIPNWNVWKNVHEADLDEAVALSLGIDPQKIRKRGYPTRADHQYDDETQEFKERLFLARRNRPNIGVIHQVPLLDPSVNLQLFARWALLIGWQMPDAMIEIAEGKTLDQLLDEWIRKRWGPNFENLPGRDDLLALAREEVSPNVSEAQVRHLRKKYATAEAIKGGANFHRNKRSQ